ARPEPGRPARRRDVLRVRRHVRGEERRRVRGDLRGQGGGGPPQRGRGTVRGGQLVPDARRRGAAAAAVRGGGHAPGGDPGPDRGGGPVSAPHPGMPTYLGLPSFPAAARTAVADSQLRANLTHATRTIRAKRAGAVAELSDWEQLR